MVITIFIMFNNSVTIFTKERMLVDYHDRENWIAKVITNIAMAGFFSSDRTIEDYNRDIWKLN